MGAVFGWSGAPDPDLRERMSRALAHRGAAEELGAETATATVGYRALFAAPERQRLGSGLLSDGGVTIAVAGFLTGLGGAWRGDLPDPPSLADLLDAYRRRGIGFANELRGAFVLAVADRGTLHLVRDGAGARTVYWARNEGRLLFAVEPKALLSVPGFPRRLRPAAVAQYLTFSFIPGAATMLEGVHELPPGHRLTSVGVGEPRVERWFVFEEGEKEKRSDEEWVERFRELHGRAVAERLRVAGESVGLFLSGGLDSSVVAAEAVRQGALPLSTTTIHFGPSYRNELEYARAVAERLGTEHQEVLIRPRSFLPRLRRMIWHLDEPIGDPITMPNFELARRVAGDVRFVLNGEGGDPVFGGPKNLPLLLQHWYGGVERDALWRERAYLASYRRAYEDLDRLLTPEFRAQFDREEALEGVLTPFFHAPRPRGFVDKLMAINIRLKGAHLILPKVERMLAAAGLVSMSPLFDERLIEQSFRMPATLKLARGVEKVILKRAYAGALPRSVIERPKMGMAVPVHFWLRGEMKRYARRILRAKSLRRAGIFEPERVRQLLAYEIQEGPGRYGLKLWMLLTFELWRRIVIEGEAV